jgi:glycosyltransferase involved in cell wall biosynthesis
MTVFTAYNQRTRGGAYVLWRELVVRLGQHPAFDLVYASPEAISGAEGRHCRIPHPDPSRRLGTLLFLIHLFCKACFIWKPPAGSVVISQGNLYNLALAPLCWKGARMLTIIHGDYLLEYERNRHPGWLKAIVHRLLIRAYRRSEWFLPVSQDLKRRTIEQYGLPEERFHVVPNAVPELVPMSEKATHQIREDWNARENRPLVLYIGALAPIKRVDLLVDAIKHLAPDKRPDLRIIGDGPLREELEQRVRTQGLSKDIAFTGALPHARDVLAAGDLLVLCSENEGSPTVLMECLARGVLAIGSRAGGIPEVIGIDELLFESGNVQALSEKLRDVLEMPETERVALRERWLERRSLFSKPWPDRVMEVLSGA